MNLAITGATSGIGAETALALAPKCKQLFLLVRNSKKGEALRDTLKSSSGTTNIEIIFCDLTDLKSEAAAADTLAQKIDHLDVLINNAGGIFPEGELTADGFETTFQVNHLGHFLLTRALMPLLLNSTAPRVINVSSEAHKAASGDLKKATSVADYKSFPVYADAKLYNILFTKSLDEKYGQRGLGAYSLHPGVVKTNFGGQHKGVFKFLLKIAQPFMISAKQGAETSIYLASEPLKNYWSGGYFNKSKPSSPSSKAIQKQLRDELWEKSAEWVQPYAPSK